MTYFQVFFFSFSSHNLFWVRMRIAIFSIFFIFDCIYLFNIICGGIRNIAMQFLHLDSSLSVIVLEIYWLFGFLRTAWNSNRMHECSWRNGKWHCPHLNINQKIQCWLHANVTVTMVQTRFCRRYAFSVEPLRIAEVNEHLVLLTETIFPRGKVLNFECIREFPFATDTNSVTLERIRA